MKQPTLDLHIVYVCGKIYCTWWIDGTKIQSVTIRVKRKDKYVHKVGYTINVF